jgi:NAD(P)H-nitrite reductase large subunit
VSEPLVIAGNGMAAARLIDELAKVALGHYAIAVIGDDIFKSTVKDAERLLREAS